MRPVAIKKDGTIKYYPILTQVSGADIVLLIKSENGVLVDKSKNNYDISNIGAVVNSQGFTLGSTTGYLKMPSPIDLNNDYTIEWIEHCNGAQQPRAGIFYFSGVSDINPLCVLGYGITRLYMGTGINWGLIGGDAAKDRTNYQNITWAMQRRGDVISVYKNGILFFTKTIDATAAITLAETLWIGNYYATNIGYNANILEFMITARAKYDNDFDSTSVVFSTNNNYYYRAIKEDTNE